MQRSLVKHANAAHGCCEESCLQPVVFKVGSMGSGYWEWVNQPVQGQPRFFHSDVLEAVTKVEWWTVPLVWLPVVSFLGMHGWQLVKPTPLYFVLLLCTGFALWHLFEYAIHRFLFHHHTVSYWGITLHFLFHGCHHKYPFDKQRLVFPPVPAALIATGIFTTLRMLFPYADALVVMSGLLVGYVVYDCMHYAIHHGKGWKVSYLPKLRQHHLSHHFKNNHVGYGISSTWVDALFNTLDKA